MNSIKRYTYLFCLIVRKYNLNLLNNKITIDI